MGLIPSIDARLAYRNASARLKKRKISTRRAVLSQCYLEFETTLDTQRTIYNFPIGVTQQSANGSATLSPFEQRLTLNDSFFVSHLGFGVRVTNYNGSDSLKDIIYTFPSTALKDGLVGDRLQGVWAGWLSLNVNNRVICPQWDVSRHYYAPQTQRPYFTVPPADYVWTDQKDGSQDGFYPVEPNWVLIGSKDNILSLQLPHPLGTSVIVSGATVEFKAVVIVRGILAQNSTSVR